MLSKTVHEKMAKKLSEAAREEIGRNWDLAKSVGETLKITPSALNNTLSRNGPKLNQYEVVDMVAKHMNVEAASILEEVEEI